LQTAAVIARTCLGPSEVGGVTYQNRSAPPHPLQGSEFLYEMKSSPSLNSRSSTPLSHEVAYAGLLETDGRASRSRHGGNRTAHATGWPSRIDRLAYHALRGEGVDKAVSYFRQAGRRLSTRSAFEKRSLALSRLGPHHLPGSRNNRQYRLRLDLWSSWLPSESSDELSTAFGAKFRGANRRSAPGFDFRLHGWAILAIG